MRAAKMKDRPGFLLMKQSDVQSIYYMQMPRWLFSDPRYADMSLDAKVAYTFLLNRFQLSRRKGWASAVSTPWGVMTSSVSPAKKRFFSSSRAGMPAGASSMTRAMYSLS